METQFEPLARPLLARKQAEGESPARSLWVFATFSVCLACFFAGFSVVVLARSYSKLPAPASDLVAPGPEAFHGVVKTSCGTYAGVPVPNKTDLFAWRGIRYGAAERWQPPTAAACVPTAAF